MVIHTSDVNFVWFYSEQPQLLAAVKFLAHLVNQRVAHEIMALELLTVLLEIPTDDSVEVAVGFVTECGSILQDLCPKGLHGRYMWRTLYVIQLVALSFLLLVCLLRHLVGGLVCCLCTCSFLLG